MIEEDKVGRKWLRGVESDRVGLNLVPGAKPKLEYRFLTMAGPNSCLFPRTGGGMICKSSSVESPDFVSS